MKDGRSGSLWEFRENDKNLIILDFSGARTVPEVHQMLKEAFGFPEYYGRNWDALNDCLQDFLSDGDEYAFELRGFYAMDDQLRAQCAPMMAVLRDVQEETGNMTFVVVS